MPAFLGRRWRRRTRTRNDLALGILLVSGALLLLFPHLEVGAADSESVGGSQERMDGEKTGDGNGGERITGEVFGGEGLRQVQSIGRLTARRSSEDEGEVGKDKNSTDREREKEKDRDRSRETERGNPRVGSAPGYPERRCEGCGTTTKVSFGMTVEARIRFMESNSSSPAKSALASPGAATRMDCSR